ncbi:ER-derived vesicles protein erv46 [Entomophthora muscae]|uniref:ER-derived vesicles protein erv46 n=3 Tax=Entomophthora muscae TaxID=34485 RepID=A0ACC2RMI7_9FUNG|nr:ER-derived vesicles protein erv46 [Entomophthora muscae]
MGGLITLISGLFVALLTISEIREYLSVSVSSELSVDISRSQVLPIYFDVSFPKIPCYLATIDSTQSDGESQINISSEMFKTRIDKYGLELDKKKTEPGDNTKAIEFAKKAKQPGYCGSCYGASPAGECCNSCNAVKKAYIAKSWDINQADHIEQCVAEGWTNEATQQKGEGCRLHGRLVVKKIPGVFHVALGESLNFFGMHVHSTNGVNNYDYSHTIHKLSFGIDSENFGNSLRGATLKISPGPVRVQYFLKVVATDVNPLSGELIQTYQYSVTQHTDRLEEASALPGVFFKFDISPMLVTMTQYRRSFVSFLIDLCAIIGGVATVAGIIDSMAYKAERALSKKVQIGKAY